jgi:hypothetical protein
MRRLVVAVLSLGAAAIAVHAVAVRAQDGVPNLKGTWNGKGNAIVFGNNAHHPGSQTPSDPPRVHEIEAKYVFDGQDGHLVWGHSSSAAANTREPLAWAIASDNKTIYGADADGYYHITLVSSDRMEKCYMQDGNGPTHAVVAACFMMDRVKP